MRYECIYNINYNNAYNYYYYYQYIMSYMIGFALINKISLLSIARTLFCIRSGQNYDPFS